MDEDYDERAQRLKQQAAEAKQEADAQHDALLEAAAKDEELVVEETDTTTIGDATLTVKTTVSGDSLRQIDKAGRADAMPGQQLDAIVDLLAKQTERIEAEGVVLEKDSDIRAFFRQFIDNHDADSAGKLCMNRVIEEPCNLEMDRRQDVIRGFPSEGRSPEPRRSNSGRS